MRWLNLPNLLTSLRIVLTPFVVQAIVSGQYRRAVVLLLVAGSTDGLDGYVARRFRWQTRLGAYLDPLADKALLGATYVALGIAGQLPVWLVALVFGRDILILLMAAFALLFTRHRDFPPSVWGKLSTFLQVGAAFLWVCAAAFPLPWLSALAALSVWLVAAGTAWSGIDYVVRGVRMLRAGPAVRQPVP